MFGVTTWILFLGVLIVGCGIAIVSVVLQCLGCCNRAEHHLVPISWHLTHTIPPHGGAGPTGIHMGGMQMGERQQQQQQPPQPGRAVRKPNKIQPLPAHMIQRLPSFFLEPTITVDEVECSICQEELADSKVVSLPCGHIFHKGCVTSWLQLQATCPTCRLLLSDKVLGLVGDVEQGLPEAAAESSVQQNNDENASPNHRGRASPRHAQAGV